MANDGILYETKTDFNHYKVADTVYSGRPARVLYGGNGITAQSGLALDDNPELLFDYNERFMEIARGIEPKSLLLIGGGGFTLPIGLMKQFSKMEIDTVEIDKKLLDIAKKYFGFKPNKHTHVFIGDGRHFIDSIGQEYEMIVMDVFIDADIPRPFQTPEAAQSLRRCLSDDGVLAVNIIGALHGIRAATLHRMKDILKPYFKDIQVFPASGGLSGWMGQNFVLTAQNQKQDLRKFLRFDPVKI